jgi:aspartyl-tRNA(Asn)/glutamyl-tRNA(Gln) amidotransferase subunit B
MEYRVTIGLEVHAQILTRSKMFCGCSADYAGAAPNTHVCPVCLGLPGSLPVVNAAALERAAVTGLALNATIDTASIISRKNYTYPDLPSSYQRSQYDDPLCRGGWLEIVDDDGAPKRIGITRVHIEEDTGKLTHAADGSSLVDYNRSGVALMEIVSEPDIASPEEARRYFQKLQQILVWIGVNTGNMEDGALRCDANVSVKPTHESGFGAKVEIKNINSFRNVERALAYEIRRQIGVLESGGAIRQTTRGWDEAHGETVEQRSKEDANDYRYFPEPDIPPLRLSEEWVEARHAALPELPGARAQRFQEAYGLSAQDAELLTGERAVADYYEQAVAASGNAKEAANWVGGELFRLLNDAGEDIAAAGARLTPQHVAGVTALVANGTITRTVAKQVFEESFRSGAAPEQIVRERGLTQISDSGAIATVARDVLALPGNAKAIAEYRGGKASAIQFLVGQLMKATKGQANPQAARAVLEELLAE